MKIINIEELKDQLTVAPTNYVLPDHAGKSINQWLVDLLRSNPTQCMDLLFFDNCTISKFLFGTSPKSRDVVDAYLVASYQLHLANIIATCDSAMAVYDYIDLHVSPTQALNLDDFTPTPGD